MIIGLGILLCGLFLGLRDFVPYMTARRSGVIVRKGAQGVRVLRDDNPEGFDRLLANRRRGMMVGLVFVLGGAVWLGLSWIDLLGGSQLSALLTWVLSIGLAIFAAYCLVRGFTTGRMFAFWGLSLFGEAVRTHNPTWFWTYAGFNLLSVLFGGYLLLIWIAALI